MEVTISSASDYPYIKVEGPVPWMHHSRVKKYPQSATPDSWIMQPEDDLGLKLLFWKQKPPEPLLHGRRNPSHSYSLN